MLFEKRFLTELREKKIHNSCLNYISFRGKFNLLQ